MSLLDRFEQSLERLMEGTTGSLFRQSLQPAEIGKKLERAMTSRKQVSVGGALVPNRFVVQLHPKDFAQFKDYRDGLSRQLEAHLAQYASRHRFAVIDRIHVSIEENDVARKRQPQIDATIADSRRSGPGPNRTPAPAQATAAFDAVPRRDDHLVLRIASGPEAGREYAIGHGTSTVGRSADNTVVIDTSDVSRRHARIEYSSGRLRVYDLNSTNGTRVNGEAVRIADVEIGDRITFGACTLELRSENSADDHGRYSRAV